MKKKYFRWNKKMPFRLRIKYFFRPLYFHNFFYRQFYRRDRAKIMKNYYSFIHPSKQIDFDYYGIGRNILNLGPQNFRKDAKTLKRVFDDFIFRLVKVLGKRKKLYSWKKLEQRFKGRLWRCRFYFNYFKSFVKKNDYFFLQKKNSLFDRIRRTEKNKGKVQFIFRRLGLRGFITSRLQERKRTRISVYGSVFTFLNYHNKKRIFRYKRSLFWLNLKSSKRFRRRRRKLYHLILNDKQRLKYFYGNMTEFKLKSFIKKAFFNSIFNLTSFVFILESRLASILYRGGFGKNMMETQQMIKHGFFCVNGQVAFSANYLLKIGDVISLNKRKAKRFTKKYFKIYFVERILFFGYPSSYMEYCFYPLSIVFYKRPALTSIYYPFFIDIERLCYFYSV